MLTLENYKGIQDAIEIAREDDTPILAVSEDEIAVLGDPNKTKAKKGNYKIKFAFPKTEEWIKSVGAEKIEKYTQNYIVTSMEFKDVTVTPRTQAKVTAAFVELYAFFTKVESDGTVVDPTLEDVKSILSELTNEIEDKMYNAVATVLEISPKYADYMLLGDVIRVTGQLIADFPDIINEADLFFG